jgi:aquaporin Z
VGGDAVGQLWLFWAAPIVGALLAGWFYRQVLSEEA